MGIVGCCILVLKRLGFVLLFLAYGYDVEG